MKKNLIQKTGLVLFIAVSIVLSCDTNTLTGQTVKENRNLSGFNGVSLSFSGNVYITQGNEFKVQIEADKDVMDVLITEIQGDKLVFKTRNGVWRNLGDVKAYVTMPEITELTVAGSGDMICETALNSDELELGVSGSGSIRISNLTARELSAVVTGSGDIIVRGQSKDNSELEGQITGSGNLRTEDFAVKEATIQVTGSGSASVNVTSELETNITGSGSVHYRGNPLVNANATGSGHTRSMN